MKKWKKIAADIILHTCTKNHNIWCTVPEIRNESDRIFCHFGPFFALLTSQTRQKIKILKNWKNTWRYYHFTHVYHKWQSWWMVPEIWSVTDKTFFFILDSFLHFYPPNNPENPNFEKMKKMPGNIIILHMCTINDSHIIHGSWDMECDGHNFLSFWILFLPFYTPPPPNNPKNQNLKKKQQLEISSFYTCLRKIMITDVQLLRRKDERMERRTYGLKKWHIEVGAPLKNIGENCLVQGKQLPKILLKNTLVTSHLSKFWSADCNFLSSKIHTKNKFP